MKKKDKQASDGFNSLLGAYTNALNENSKNIEEMLNILKTRKLSDSNKKELKSIKREFERIDGRLKDIGEDNGI